MAVDFKKRLKKTDGDIKKHPKEIYDALDRKSITGPLRPAQKTILNGWFDKRKDDRDLIIKLHTGAGKTLIGLLILLSKLNSKEGPCLYICPNRYLVKQVCDEADKFGVSYCTINETNEIPDAFTMGKSILITHAQKVFNGRTIFGIDASYIKVGCVIMDDSHACIDVINDAFTINVPKETCKKAYEGILSLFEDELREQGEGTYLDLINDDYDAMLPVPYWAWNNKKSEVLNILSENKSVSEIGFAWQLLKNCIDKCKVFVSNRKVEITPYYIPIQLFGTFKFAKSRILMSATTQNDSFFINGLGFGVDAIKKPLVDTTVKWSGEKMILIPSLIYDECDRGAIIKKFGTSFKKKFGIVSLVSSSNKAKIYEKYGAKITNTNSIFDDISNLKAGKCDDTLVIYNRYDGIDLPDESCRVLILDSLPYFDTLSDQYEESCRPNSETINRKIAQKIEQGLGRSVRGEKDYSVILIIGSDLVKFVKSVTTNIYFSKLTQKQIEIGFEIAEMVQADTNSNENPLHSIISLVNQSLHRDEGWKDFYGEGMESIEDEIESSNVYTLLNLESIAEKAYYDNNYEKAVETIQKVIDILKDEREKGWYLQCMARYTNMISVSEANKLQKFAFLKNNYLLKPKDGVNYQKISYINGNRINKIKEWISQFPEYTEMSIQAESILDELSFGMEAEKFEAALKNVGEMLGFSSQRPDKIIRKGPDNLWCIQKNEYIMFECKSEVKDDRNEIIKYEAGQMNSHCGWFEEEYRDAKVTRFLIISTKNLAYDANFTHDIKIIRKSKLKELKANIRKFIKELKNYNLNELTDKKLQEIINLHDLDIESLKTVYCESYYHNKK
jgi:Superfamily II helicase